MYDLILRNGTVIDGAKTPRFQADVGIVADRIEAVGDLSAAEARTVLDVSGSIVAPGFVDVHNHSDSWLLNIPHLVPKSVQGFTTEVLMADGISYAPVSPETITDWIYYLRTLNGLRPDEYEGWQTIADYMHRLNGRTAQNVMTHVPYANVRALASGFGSQRPDDYQMRQIRALIQQGMDEGAVGLSTGLDYVGQCFSGTDELVEATEAIADAGGLYVTHVRYKKGTLQGVQEAVEIGRRAGVAVHISHLKGESEAECEAIIGYIDRVAVNEVDFSFDVYPYVASSTMLNYLLPYEVWEDGPLGVVPKLKSRSVRDRFAHSLATTPLDRIYIGWVASRHNARHQGKKLSDYIAEVGGTPADVLCDLLIDEGLAVLLVFRRASDDLVEPFLAHDRYMMGSDGIYFPDAVVHPRVYGSAPRLLGFFARDRRLFSLEDAVNKLSGYPAQRFGLKDRGILAAGKYADVVVFDAERVSDPATYAAPDQLAVGVEHVLVNGTPIIQDGQPVTLGETMPGRYLRYRQ